MQIVNEYPPNYKAICKAFPAVKYSRNVVFTYSPSLYIPNGSDQVMQDLMVHENYHQERQVNVGGPEKWWDLYLKDPKFRAEEELGAYQRQYKYARKHYARQVFSQLLDRIAGDLSGPMYGNIYSKEEAKDLIRGKYK